MEEGESGKSGCIVGMAESSCSVDYGIGCYRARVELCSVLEYINPSIIRYE